MDDPLLQRNLRPPQPMRRQQRLHCRLVGADVGRVVRQAHEDRAPHDLHVHGLQTMLRLVEIVRHVRSPGQRPIQPVGPAVIRAHEPLHRPACLVQDPAPAMPARVVERPHGTLIVPQHDDRRGPHAQRDELPRCRHLAFPPPRKATPGGRSPPCRARTARRPCRRTARGYAPSAGSGASGGRRSSWRVPFDDGSKTGGTSANTPAGI